MFHSLSNAGKEVQFCESYWKFFLKIFSKKVRFVGPYSRKKGSILLVVCKILSRSEKKELNQLFESCSTKWFNSVSHVFFFFFEKKFNSVSHQKSFFILIDIFQKINSSSHFFKRVLILWDISIRKFKSSSHLLKEGSILWVLWVIFYEKKSILWVKFFWNVSVSYIFTKRSIYSLSHIFCEIGIFFESYQKWSHFLWLVLKRRVQFRESHGKNGSVLWVMFFLQKSSILRDICEKKVQFFEFCEAYFIRKNSLSCNSEKFLWVMFKKGFNSSCHLVKRVQFFESPSEECSILWVKFLKIRFNSLSHIPKKSSILWVVFKKNVQFFEIRKVFNWVSEKMGSILCVMKKKKKVQFFWVTKRVQFLSHIRKRFNSSSQKIFLQKSLSLFPKNVKFSEFCEKVHVFEPFAEEDSILWVTLKKRVECFESYSILWVQLIKILNSVSRIEKGRFFGSYSKKKKLFDSLSHVSKKLFNSLSHQKKFLYYFRKPILRVIFQKKKV